MVNPQGAFRLLTELQNLDEIDRKRYRGLEELRDLLVTLRSTYDTRIKTGQFAAQIDIILTKYNSIRALGQPVVHPDVWALHRQGLLSIPKVTGKLDLDYNRLFYRVFQFVNMAKKETEKEEIKRNLDAAVSALLATLQTEIEFAREQAYIESKTVEIINKQRAA